MRKKAVLCISSCTGNTKKILEALEEELRNKKYEIYIWDKKSENIIEDDALVIIGFWCRRSTLDFESQRAVNLFKKRDILAFGTMGSYPDSEYGKRVEKNIYEYINQENRCLGVYISQGKVSLKRTEIRRRLPKDHPHYLNEEGVKRHLESQKHPNEDDIRNAILFLRKNLV